MSSVDALLHHPRAVGVLSLPPTLRWTCRTPVEDGEEYTLERKPHSFLPLAPPEVLSELCQTWLRRRRISIQCAWFGLLEPARRRVWMADMVGEQGRRPMLVVVYFTAHKQGAPRRAMREYAAGLRRVCRDVYRVRCGSALLNVYGRGRAEGEIVWCDP
jgi:hypothetical protein